MLIIRTKALVIGLFYLAAFVTPGIGQSKTPPVKTDHPRDTMETFMGAMKNYRKGREAGDKKLIRRIDDAVRCLNLEETPRILRQEKGREAAIFLKEYIDRRIVVDLSKVPEATDPKTGQPMIRWRLKNTDVEIKLIEEGNRKGEFLFSKDTTYRAKENYERYKDEPYLEGTDSGAMYKPPWIETNVPEWARKKYMFFPNWQWMGLFIAILFGLIIKTVTTHFLHVVKRVAEKSRTEWDHRALFAVERPVGLVACSIFWLFSIHALQFDGTPLTILTVAVQVVLSIGVIWTIYGLADVLSAYLMMLAACTESTLDDHLVPLIRKALKIFVVVFGVLVMFQNLGVDVMAVLAGLGLGGLAFALAAKDMCANFFGSIMILLDRPFSIGDWVVVGNEEGTVEEIGFRSTRIRTFYNSLVTIPNAALANASIDNMGAREYRRIKAFFGLTYDTPPEKMEAFLEGVKNIVEANPYTRKDYYHVVFNSYADSSLEVMLYCFLKVPNWATELVERQHIYLEVLRLAKDIGVDFAFPTQSVHIETFPEKETVRKPHDIDMDALSSAAGDYGPRGSRSNPGGQGIFVAPYKISHGASEDEES